MLKNKAKYLSLMVLVGMAGCTTNQYITRSGSGYDDLYGGNSGPAVTKAVKTLGWFVLVGWAIYPVGYIAGTAGGLFGFRVFEGLSMDIVYNIGDAINKIGFGLVIYALAQSDKVVSPAKA